MFKFMLTILSAVAEMEREVSVERFCERIAKAKKYGTSSGRSIGRYFTSISMSMRQAKPE